MQISTDLSRTPRILVLGGTGKTGRRVTASLRAAGVDAVTAARRGDRHFDWNSPRTWDDLWDGADAAYLVDSQGPDAADRMADVLSGARRAGLRRAVLLSARAWAPSPEEAEITQSLSAVETAVMEAVDDWTVMRPTWFVQNLWEDPLFADAIRDGELLLPEGEGREPLIDARDIADVAARCLLEDGHRRRAYALSGPELTTFAAAARLLVEAGLARCTVASVTEREYRRHLQGRGLSEDHVDLAVTLLGELAAGAGAYLSDGVEAVTGRPPRPVREVIGEDAPGAVAGNEESPGEHRGFLRARGGI